MIKSQSGSSQKNCTVVSLRGECPDDIASNHQNQTKPLALLFLPLKQALQILADNQVAEFQQNHHFALCH